MRPGLAFFYKDRRVSRRIPVVSSLIIERHHLSIYALLYAAGRHTSTIGEPVLRRLLGGRTRTAHASFTKRAQPKWYTIGRNQPAGAGVSLTSAIVREKNPVQLSPLRLPERRMHVLYNKQSAVALSGL